MRVHLLALPTAQTTQAYTLCGFVSATIKFATILKRLGHHVTLYASEENDAPCDELVTIITKEELAALFSMGPVEKPWLYQHARIEADSPCFQLGNARMALAINQRKQHRDVICQIGGASQQFVTERTGLQTIEYSIGYEGSFSACRVFESHAWRHETYGRQGIKDGRFFDTVIPYFVDARDFPVCTRPDDYYLFVGRFISRKGLQIVSDMAKAAGVKVKWIGHGGEAADHALMQSGEILGSVDSRTRNEVMSKAIALIAPTLYLEPFNAAVIEAQMCGTPTISTDWGGLTETVEQGVSGYRCTYLGQFIDALEWVKDLDRRRIAERARRLYSLEAVAPQYQAYFDRVQMLWADGFNTVHPALVLA